MLTVTMIPADPKSPAMRQVVSTFDFSTVVPGLPILSATVLVSATMPNQPDKVERLRKDITLMTRNAISYREGVAWSDKTKAIKAGEEWIKAYDLGPIVAKLAT